MTPTEKMLETRKRNKEARKAQTIALQFLTDKALENCKMIFDDPEATSAERLRAIELFNDLKKSR